jgi:hypothetical protein
MQIGRITGRCGAVGVQEWWRHGLDLGPLGLDLGCGRGCVGSARSLRVLLDGCTCGGPVVLLDEVSVGMKAALRQGLDLAL